MLRLWFAQFWFPCGLISGVRTKKFYLLLFVHIGVSVKSPVFSPGIFQLEKFREIDKVKALDSCLLSFQLQLLDACPGEDKGYQLWTYLVTAQITSFHTSCLCIPPSGAPAPKGRFVVAHPVVIALLHSQFSSLFILYFSHTPLIYPVSNLQLYLKAEEAKKWEETVRQGTAEPNKEGLVAGWAPRGRPRRPGCLFSLLP